MPHMNTKEVIRNRGHCKGSHKTVNTQSALLGTPVPHADSHQPSTNGTNSVQGSHGKPSNSSLNDGLGNQDIGCLKRTVSLHKGLILAFMSCLFQASGSIGVKMLTGRIPPTQVAAVRLFFYIMFSSVCLIYYRVPLRVSRKQLGWLLIRVTAGTSAMCLSFYAYQNIPVGDTTAILFTSPIFTGIFAWILLGEKFTLTDAALALFALVGIVLIARPSFLFREVHGASSKDGNALLGVICALIGAIFASLVFVMIRKLGGINVHPFVQIWVFGVAGVILSSAITTIIGVWEMPWCGKERLILIFVGFTGFMAQLLMTLAFKIEKAAYVAVIKSNSVILAFVLEFAIFGTVPFWLSIVGTGLVMFSSLGITVKKWRSAKNKDKDTEDNEAREEEDEMLNADTEDLNGEQREVTP